MITRAPCRVASCAAIAVLAHSSFAGSRRHDVCDDLHVTLGDAYPSVCRIRIGANGRGSGTLVAPQWVLTAAHVVAQESSGYQLHDLSAYTVYFENGTFSTTPCEIVLVDPTWGEPGWSGPDHAQDLALICLSDVPPQSIPPVPRFIGVDERGSPAVLVGYGLRGNGRCSCGMDADDCSPSFDPNDCISMPPDDLRRAGVNTLDVFGSDYFGDPPLTYGLPYWLIFSDFDDPDDPSASYHGSATPEPMEYFSCSGDSGGAVFIGTQLAGVIKAGSSGRYGSFNAHTRVSQFNWWINAVSNTIAYGHGSTAAVTVGAGAVWNHDGPMHVGYGKNANGTIAIEGGGQLSVLEGSLGVGLGDPPGRSQGHIVVADPDSSLTCSGTGWFNIGEIGLGTLSISNGATATCAGWTNVAVEPGSEGSVSVTGPGSVLDVEIFNVGMRDAGTLVVEDSASLEFDELNLGRDVVSSDGQCSITNGGHAEGGLIRLGWRGVGSLSIETGGTLQTLGGHVGLSAGSSGLVVLRGAASSASASSFLNVGDEGLATVDISEGAVLSVTGWMSLGVQVLGDGAVTVSDSGSHLGVDVLSVGRWGSGALHVSEEASFSFDSLVLGRDTLSSRGETNIAQGGSGIGNSVTVGWEGAGTLTVETGGRLDVLEDAWIGKVAGSNGSIVVRDSGSALDISHWLHVGRSGTGTLTVEGAAVAQVGTRIDVAQNGTVAAAGGSITVGPGTADTTPGRLRIHAAGRVSGSGTIVANIVNDGIVIPGASAGALRNEGDYTQSANGTLLVEIGGVLAGSEYDQLSVTGQTALDGALDVSLIAGFQPCAGDRFVALIGGTRSGAFAQVIVPPLAEGLLWWVEYGPSTVELIVTVPHDLDRDGDVDSNDFGIFAQCMSGPEVLTPPPGCDPVLFERADLDEDGDVDSIDFALFQVAFGGS